MGGLASCRRTFRAMGSINEIELHGDDAMRLEQAADAAVADVLRIEAKYSRYREDSVVTEINRAAGGPAVAIDAETAALLRYADALHAASRGRFDITSGVLRRAWDFRSPAPALPDPARLRVLTALVDWGAVEWDDRQVRLPTPGMEIDFGGIGKEYAVDRAATICVEAGVRHALVNLGGDVRAVGAAPSGAPWRVGVRHPRVDGAVLGVVEVRDAAVATSGDYERFVEIGGRRYSHLLDPRSGMPVSRWQSMTVVAPLCVHAGGIATSAMLLEDDAPGFLDEQSVRWCAADASGLRGNLSNASAARPPGDRVAAAALDHSGAHMIVANGP